MDPQSIGRFGDYASIVGLFVSLLGFVLTLLGVYRSKAAAEQARAAAEQTRSTIQMLNAVDDFSAALAVMEEIKRLHRAGAWNLLPDRYSELRKRLLSLRTSDSALSDGHVATIQAAIQQFADIERRVERAVSAQSPPPNIPRLNGLVSQQISRIHELLTTLKNRPRS